MCSKIINFGERRNEAMRRRGELQKGNEDILPDNYEMALFILTLASSPQRAGFAVTHRAESNVLKELAKRIKNSRDEEDIKKILSEEEIQALEKLTGISRADFVAKYLEIRGPAFKAKRYLDKQKEKLSGPRKLAETIEFAPAKKEMVDRADRVKEWLKNHFLDKLQTFLTDEPIFDRQDEPVFLDSCFNLLNKLKKPRSSETDSLISFFEKIEEDEFFLRKIFASVRLTETLPLDSILQAAHGFTLRALGELRDLKVKETAGSNPRE